MKYFLILLSLFLCSCNSRVKTEPDSPVTKESEDFSKFNKKFHSDSIFQIERIKFPLNGHGRDGFKTLDWSANNWEMLKTAVGDTTDIADYKHTAIVTDSIVIEKYWLPDSGFSTERKFKKIDGKWYLVYFNDINL